MLVFLGLWAALLLPLAPAVTISEINGNRYLSSYQGTQVADVEGVVTAKDQKGFYLRSTTPDADPRTSESIYVYGTSAVAQVSVGDIITLSGTVSEYRSSSSYVYLTEITSPSDIQIASSANAVTPIVIGADGEIPPTAEFSSLDGGNVLGLPANASQISTENPILQPSRYGMDFWESRSGELATLTGVSAISKPNKYGDTWVVGDWTATGQNERGGLTMRVNDSNPEAILIGSPLDGTKNPTDTRLGDTLGNVTGIITQAYGYYALLPLTALTVTASNASTAGATTLVSDGSCQAVTVGSYNVNNLAPDSTSLSGIAGHIAKELKSPSLVFLQEIQDGSGATDDGVSSANVTLSALVSEIQSQGGKRYRFVDIDPIDGKDGGQPGGNIRVAYLYDATVIGLSEIQPGSSSDANVVLDGPKLKYNPGLIDPNNAAWTDSRKPLVAEWETVDGGGKLFTINVHFTSKGGGSPVEGDARPPVNGGIAQRESQARVTADFVQEILSKDPQARIITAGDFNEFAFAQPLTVFQAQSGLRDLDEEADIPVTERYTYLYDSNCQQLDHVFISPALAQHARMEHIHVNTWAAYSEQASDHDPSVAMVNVCG